MSLFETLAIIIMSAICLFLGTVSFMSFVISKDTALVSSQAYLSYLQTKAIPRYASGDKELKELNELVAVSTEKVLVARIELGSSAFAWFKPKTQKALSSADASIRALQDKMSKVRQRSAGGDTNEKMV